MCSISHMFLEAVLQQSCPVLCCPCLQSSQVHTGSGECPDIHPRQCSKGCNPSPHPGTSACALLPDQWLSCFCEVTQNLQSVFLACSPVDDRWHHCFLNRCHLWGYFKNHVLGIWLSDLLKNVSQHFFMWRNPQLAWNSWVSHSGESSFPMLNLAVHERSMSSEIFILAVQSVLSFQGTNLLAFYCLSFYPMPLYTAAVQPECPQFSATMLYPGLTSIYCFIILWFTWTVMSASCNHSLS